MKRIISERKITNATYRLYHLNYRNEANGEGNRDGTDENLSWNCGAKGPTDDPAIRRLRARQQRNFLAALILSVGVPMLVAGDEIGKTQQGNNNAYCQDNGLSWVDWNLDQGRQELLQFTKSLIQLFHAHPVLRRRKFFHGRVIRESEVKDLTWFRLDGKEITDQDWANRLPSGEELFKKTGHDMDEGLAVLMRKCSDRGRQDYNTIRPHSVLNYRLPAPEAILPPT